MVIIKRKKKSCSFPNCTKPKRRLGYCDGHYSQIKSGRELKPLKFKRPNNTEPIIKYTEIPCPVKGLEGPCHIFTGIIDRDGYGKIRPAPKAKRVSVHRYVWKKFKGYIPPYPLDHQCRNRACCNVKHLRVVTERQNALENSISITAINAKKTHCKYGHEFTEQNTYRNKSGGRVCRTCQRANQKRQRNRIK